MRMEGAVLFCWFNSSLKSNMKGPGCQHLTVEDILGTDSTRGNHKADL